MSEEAVIADTRYISSKRASEISGYTQDYIGQLARAGKIEGTRVEGLWYIKPESLEEHKQQSDSHVPAVPSQEYRAKEPESVVTFEGKRFISSSKAAEMTGYAQDYIGQLARSGAIPAQQAGSRWYVDAAALGAHKAEKDALLAKVQAEAVGLYRHPAGSTVSGISKMESREPVSTATNLHYSYFTQESSQLPLAGREKEHNVEPEDEHRIPIRVMSSTQSIEKPKIEPVSRHYAVQERHTPRRSRTLAAAILAGVALCASSYGAYAFLGHSAALEGSKNSEIQAHMAALAGNATTERLGAYLSSVLNAEIEYQRRK